MTLTIGNKCACTRLLTITDRMYIIPCIIGAIILNPTSVIIKPRIPAEKLLNNISKPCGVRGWMNWSVFFINQPTKGPITIAPSNIGVSGIATMTPIVATAAIIPPRISWMRRPPLYAMSNGIKYLIIGSAKLARSLLGHQPPSIKIAAIKPQAINAPMFGIIILLRNDPKAWTLRPIPLFSCVSDIEDTSFSISL